ncbi:hypothetical protein [Streptomyces fuscigenes]|uniref:hypothetical protein n=1 Tax=Streptomyces fuscigenes TaxID=1528880 RepID=UPI001F42976D|nr:hypothetical protein [Streptomyces fuscigenes]MCF3963043.1 hypothetical protein [Streptomyces fuscigenes]
MDVVSWVSAGVALAGAFATAILGYWQQQRLRTMEQRSLMDSYGASLAWAAYDFQTRLFNILNGHAVDRAPGERGGYLTSFLVAGTAQEAEYARRSTVFVLAEYLGWVEILRRDVQFLDLGNSATNRKVMGQISAVAHSLSRISPDSNELRLFRAEQRAVGELMVHPDGEPERRRCLGFAEFCARLDGDEAFRGWFRRLLDDVDGLAADTGPAVPRLGEIQRQLVLLLDLLDPRAERFPQFRAVFDGGRTVADPAASD